MKAATHFVGQTHSNFIAHPDQSARDGHKNQLTAWHKIWRALIVALAGRSEPHIWQMRNREGAIVWHVYDPATGYSGSFTSEQDVRIWLDQRYYF